MAVQTSYSPNIPTNYQVIKKYRLMKVEGTDMLSALQALVDKVETRYPNANWVIGVRFLETSVVECSAEGHPYELEEI